MFFCRRILILTLIWTIFSCCCAVVAMAESICSQFANLSPLPGDGFAVDPSGNFDGLGALQINIPVAYTPRAGSVVASGCAGGTPDDKSSFKNGTGVLGVSVGGWPRLWVSGMIVSKNAAVANGQLSVYSAEKSQLGVAVGIQGLFKTSDCQKWGYLAATKGFMLCEKNIYATFGIRGNSNNIRGIGGLSYPISDSFNFATEWDGYQFNNALAWRPGGRHGYVTLFGGYNGQTGWQAGASIYHRFTN